MSEQTRTRYVLDRDEPDALDALRDMISPEMERLREDLLRGQDEAVARSLRPSVPDEWVQFFMIDASVQQTHTVTIPRLCVGGIYLEVPTGSPVCSAFLNAGPGVAGAAGPGGPPYMTVQPAHWKRYPLNPMDTVVRVQFVFASIAGASLITRGFLTSRVLPPEAGPT